MQLEQWSGIDSLSVSDDGVTVERDGTVLQFDAAGRLRTVYDGSRIYHRGLNNTVLAKQWVETRVDGTDLRVRRVETLPPEHREELLDDAYSAAKRGLRRALEASDRSFEPPERRSIRQVLERSPETLREERRQFQSIYEPVSVLPPDQYGAVVLQSVTGCPFECSFCTLYRDAEVGVRSIAEFETHAKDVRSFFGRGIRSRRSVFLGDANPLSAPPEVLRGTLEIVAETFPEQHENGVYAFCNALTAANTTRETFEIAVDGGVERAYVGAESGSGDVLELLRKPQTPETVREGVRRLKAVGIDVGVIVLAGAGGRELAGTHLGRTDELVASLPLEASDIVYVSPLVASETADYGDRLRERSLSPLSEAEIALQAERLRSRLDGSTPARVSRYSVSGSSYF